MVGMVQVMVMVVGMVQVVMVGVVSGQASGWEGGPRHIYIHIIYTGGGAAATSVASTIVIIIIIVVVHV